MQTITLSEEGTYHTGEMFRDNSNYHNGGTGTSSLVWHSLHDVNWNDLLLLFRGRGCFPGFSRSLWKEETASDTLRELNIREKKLKSPRCGCEMHSAARLEIDADVLTYLQLLYNCHVCCYFTRLSFVIVHKIISGFYFWIIVTMSEEDQSTSGTRETSTHQRYKLSSESPFRIV